MNNRKLLTIGCALAVSVTPFSVHAASTQAAMDACADAMVSVLAAENGKPLGYRINPESDGSNARMRKRETFHLDARDPASQEVVARADCVVDGRGRVRRLVDVPLSAEDAIVRSTSF